MTDITLEQRARQLLIAELDEIGANETARIMLKTTDRDDWWVPACVAAIEAALRLSAGADGWTLELYRDRDGELGVWAKQEGGSRVWIARAAAPRHEPGEVQP